MNIEVAAEKAPQSVRLYYRHVNQGERFQSVPMQANGKNFQAAIPADYINSPYPIQYYFEIERSAKDVTLHPGLGPNLIQQPYYVVRT